MTVSDNRLECLDEVLFEATKLIPQLSTVEELQTLLENIAKPLGALVGIVALIDFYGGNSDADALLLGFDKSHANRSDGTGWLLHNRAKQFMKLDKTTTMAYSTLEPFTWKDVKETMKQRPGRQ